MSVTPTPGEPPRRFTPSTIHSEEAEKAVLGCMLAQPHEVIPDAAKQLMRSDFFSDSHQAVFTVLCQMHARGQAIDVMTVHQVFVDTKLDAELGSPGILGELLVGFATHLNVGGYIKIVRDKATLRRLLSSAVGIVKDIEEMPDRVEDVMVRAQESIQRAARSNTESSAWDIIDLKQFIEQQDALPQPEQLVENFIERGTKIIFGGASKSKKTWSMLDLGLSVAFGRTFWLMNTTRAKVLHVDFELKPKKLAERVKAIAKAKGIEFTEGWLYPLSLRGQMTSPEAVMKKILQIAKQLGVGLITIDPAYKFIAGKDENSAGDIAYFLNKLEQIVVETDAAICIANHFSKGNQAAKDPMDRISGSGVWARDADTLFVMTAHEEDDCLTVSPVLRNFKDLPEFVVRWNFPLMERAEDLDPKKLKQPAVHNAGRAERNAGEVLELLREKSMRYTEWKMAASAKLEVKEDAFKKYFRLLKEAKKIEDFQGLWRIK